MPVASLMESRLHMQSVCALHVSKLTALRNKWAEKTIDSGISFNLKNNFEVSFVGKLYE